MDRNDISEVSEQVDQAIKCAKKRLTPSGDGLIIQQKRKIDTMFHEDIPRKKVQVFRSEKKETLLFKKGWEKSGNDEGVLQSQDIYRKRS